MASGAAREALCPLTFSPVLKHYTWGGRRLAERLGRALPPGVTAESWEVSAHRNGSTPVAGGRLAGKTLPELLDRHGLDLVGHRNAAALERRRFPLLVKLLDAAQWLSVQVHPADAWALERENDYGKTEMWVVLDADDGAELIQGFAREVGRDEFARAVATGTATELLHRVPVRAGDVFHLEPGTIHALGPGVLLAEIQQSSDVTYRVFDWNRDDPDRPLHLEQALEVLDFGQVRPGPVASGRAGGGEELLVSCPHFETRRLRLAAGQTRSGSCDGATYEIWSVLEGAVEVVSATGAVALEAVGWALLPASLGDFEVRATAQAVLLRVLTPPA